MYVTGKYCWSNGVKLAIVVGGILVYRDGVLCARQEYTGDGYTWYDPEGNALGVQKIKSDNSLELTCTGESTVVVPGDCSALLVGCTYSTCTVP
jgi:hypothetical protein